MSCKKASESLRVVESGKSSSPDSSGMVRALVGHAKGRGWLLQACWRAGRALKAGWLQLAGADIMTTVRVHMIHFLVSRYLYLTSTGGSLHDAEACSLVLVLMPRHQRMIFNVTYTHFNVG